MSNFLSSSMEHLPQLLRKNPYASFLESVEKPARYIGGEHHITRKDWTHCLARVALCFPDAYEVGMSHLGFKILYDQLNKAEDILAERTYTPWPDMEKELRQRQLPLVTLESFMPLHHFHILGFSLQYEMSYSNVLTMLDLGGVSVWQKDRQEDEPFVIAGGPCATHPEAIAPFLDFVVVGDGEDIFVRIARFVGKSRLEGLTRHDILLSLAHWEGIYVPSLYNTEIDPNTGLEVVKEAKIEGIPSRIKRFFITDINAYPFPTISPIPHATAIFDNYSVELARGCTEGCRFCQAGMIYRPVRERRPKDVIQSVMDGLKMSGHDEASLTCLSTADYSAVTPLILELLDKIKEDKSTLGIASLRAYGLDKRVFDKMSEVQNTSLTFAPEAGTERMRKVINKNITEQDMLQTAEDVFSRGWQKMKLYFMIGLPTETDEDVVGIMETGKKALDVAKRLGVRRVNITVSVSSFVPKPHTPFQWVSMISMSEIERKQEILFQLARKYNLGFRKHFSQTSYLEGLVARGDRRIAQVIYSAWKYGARFDGWHECFRFDYWQKAIEDHQVELPLYLGTLRLDGRLPWSHIDVGLEDKFLEREWKKALHDRLSIPCGKPAGAIVHHSSLEALVKTHEQEKKKLVCYHCGIACDLGGMVQERKDFLTSLNAVQDSEYTPPENLGKNLLEQRQKRTGGTEFRYRIKFSKIGPISFISHLELQKIIARIFKRAGIEVLYSEGYHARPLFSFGPALTLGVSSLMEFFDVRVPRQWENFTDTLNQLQLHSERGIIFRNVSPIDGKAVSIQDSAKFFQYYFPIHEAQTEIPLEEKIAQIMDREEIAIACFSKKDGRTVEKNIRPQILAIDMATLELEDSLIDIIDEVSPCRGRKGIIVTTTVEQGSSIRPIELKQCLEQYGLQIERPLKLSVVLAS